MVSEPDAATTRAWTAIGGPAGLTAKVSYRGAGRVLPAVLPVREMARATVGACSLAAAELLAARNGGPVPGVRVDEGAVATAFVSERHLLVDGRAPTPFAPLSGFWRTADGWVRTHANYAHHRARLLAALEIDAGEEHGGTTAGAVGAGAGGDRGAALVGRLTARLAELGAQEVQERVHAAGGLAVAVAPAPDRAPGGENAGGLPLAEVGIGGAGGRRLPAAPLPAGGVRVLDLTRVIAGPVATRTLALLGADVLRVDPPGLPEDPDSHIDTGFGKRSTLVDLDSAEGRHAFGALLDSADVVVTGYRPGALDRYGLTPEALAARRPGLVVARLCAWGWSGPWSGRRGFDSLVQAARGIAAIEAKPSDPSDPSVRPGALPAQALDHGTGYLLAAGVLRALTDRQADGRGRVLRFSLAGTADWLVHGIGPEPVGTGTYGAADHLTETPSPYGLLRHALPPVHYEGAPGTWAAPPTRWGTDPAVWL
ncbi:CoA transferase [Nocardiopsis aegyptia]|uniref:Crotonobetainyl-CoA:carnitine CoA-transferase CaiB-like acyl-CoA transferase n=1 Tax=Nocardiopsis aegyptia TaxID=220378 RepID=A0A7Z0EIV3_9ACTN|nr:CoA transferase [Nocardiopsis aegyptia]NYJ32694.1 crotonobetainyl-CoA:carnitine CoA-transferase CaiB-like acyl-CoA transferase [Nocardiopsis aegyptia]